MVKFRCLQSGNIVSFDNEYDIQQLRSHPSYEEVKEEKKEEEPVFKKQVIKAKGE